ncbi:hypothetical protein DL766_000109 [Monosporascus sp. MC13-8B]|uniref:Uncharacterized protein n=1 Tax=Monosporascus cannonballus TaxID=155416 RepID=A0ABY0H6H2_9PEZI|nr:hypothetical protein DL762_005268 [Monosporascus cannonballus]RYO90431.1 hypothetical protein DL763_005351 [Monosporascus cannonballus]RYP40085.1 hypothetical protein DL766_000109 [Monosporascus sp. MC13-8B]
MTCTLLLSGLALASHASPAAAAAAERDVFISRLDRRRRDSRQRRPLRRRHAAALSPPTKLVQAQLDEEYGFEAHDSWNMCASTITLGRQEDHDRLHGGEDGSCGGLLSEDSVRRTEEAPVWEDEIGNKDEALDVDLLRGSELRNMASDPAQADSDQMEETTRRSANATDMILIRWKYDGERTHGQETPRLRLQLL